MSDKVQEFRIWQTKLYNLQREAPKPHVVPCTRNLPNRPPQYGIEYHGSISRQETERLFEKASDGAYLIRDSQRAADAYTLVIWFDRTVKNYMLHYDPVLKQHYVGENRFDTIELLVADGLIHFYVETRGADVLQKIASANTYRSTPFYKMRYHTFNASTLNNALDQMFMNSRTPKSKNGKTGIAPIEDSRTRLQRRVSPPVVKPLNSTGTPNPQSRRTPIRRQSIDAAQLARHKLSPASLESSAPTDKIGPFDKTSDSYNLEAWRYREWPPNADHLDTRMFSSNADVDLAPVPPPRRMSACVGASRQSSSPGSVLQPAPVNNSVHGGLGDARPAPPNREQSTTALSQPSRLTSVQPTGNSAQITQHGKLSYIPEDTDPASAVPTPPSHQTVAPFASLASSTGSHELSSSGSFTSNTTATSSSSYSSHPSPTDTSNSGSLVDPMMPDVSRTKLATTKGQGDSIVWRNGRTRSMDETAGKNAMLNLQERYNLPAACFADQMQSIEDSKPHNFKVHTFRGPHWCDYCTHFIWGLVAQGFKCTDCGFQAHKRCSDRVPCDCLPDIKQLKRVFGVDLTSLTRAERKSVPTILVRCIEEIEGRGALEFEGLYRIPGNHERVDQVRAAFDKDSEAADISVNRIPDVNIITSLIKSFLRQLPVPLITYEAYTDFIDVIRDEQMKDDERLNAIRKLLTRLPPAHYESLRFFMQHIHKVAQHRDVNMMSAENLAIVLSPSLMTSSYSDPISCMVGTRSEHALVERMIKDFDFLFPVTEIPVRRVPQTDSRSTDPSVNNNSKRNSQIVPAPVSPSTTSSQLGYVKRKFLRNRRSVDTPLLAAAAATITGTNTTSNERVSSPTPATPPSSAVAVSFSMNTAL